MNVPHSAFFDVSPFYYDPVEKLNLVRLDIAQTVPEEFLNALDKVDERPDRATCDTCGVPVGWLRGRWSPLGLLLDAVLVHTLCPRCFVTATMGKK